MKYFSMQKSRLVAFPTLQENHKVLDCDSMTTNYYFIKTVYVNICKQTVNHKYSYRTNGNNKTKEKIGRYIVDIAEVMNSMYQWQVQYRGPDPGCSDRIDSASVLVPGKTLQSIQQNQILS